MKTRLLVMVGMMISTTIFAQRADRGSRKSERGYERMKQELELTDEQYTSIKNIGATYSKRRDEQRDRFAFGRFEERETLRTLRRDQEREMRNVFTPEQNKKWNEFQSKKNGKHHFRGRKHKQHCGHSHSHRHERRGDRAVSQGRR